MARALLDESMKIPGVEATEIEPEIVPVIDVAVFHVLFRRMELCRKLGASSSPVAPEEPVQLAAAFPLALTPMALL